MHCEVKTLCISRVSPGDECTLPLHRRSGREAPQADPVDKTEEELIIYESTATSIKRDQRQGRAPGRVLGEQIAAVGVPGSHVLKKMLQIFI